MEYEPPRGMNPKQRAFLVAYARLGLVAHACAAARLSRRSFYLWKQKDPKFAAAAEEAKDFCVEMLEAEADRRAVEGVQRLRFDRRTGRPLIDPRTGQQYDEREYSDALLMFRLKKLDPSYRENHRVVITDQRVKTATDSLLALVSQAASNGEDHAAA